MLFQWVEEFALAIRPETTKITIKVKAHKDGMFHTKVDAGSVDFDLSKLADDAVGEGHDQTLTLEGGKATGTIKINYRFDKREFPRKASERPFFSLQPFRLVLERNYSFPGETMKGAVFLDNWQPLKNVNLDVNLAYENEANWKMLHGSIHKIAASTIVRFQTLSSFL